MKLSLSVFLACSFAVLGQQQQITKTNGWIADSACGAKHAGTPNVTCVRKCLESGAKPVLVDDQTKQVWAIENPDAVSAHLGQHVTVSMFRDDARKSIHITGVTMLADQGKAK